MKTVVLHPSERAFLDLLSEEFARTGVPPFHINRNHSGVLYAEGGFSMSHGNDSVSGVVIDGAVHIVIANMAYDRNARQYRALHYPPLVADKYSLHFIESNFPDIGFLTAGQYSASAVVFGIAVADEYLAA